MNNSTKNPTDTIVLNGNSDTCAIESDDWIIDYYTDRHVDVSCFSKRSLLSKIQTRQTFTATDLLDGTSILLKVNEASLLRDDG